MNRNKCIDEFFFWKLKANESNKKCEKPNPSTFATISRIHTIEFKNAHILCTRFTELILKTAPPISILVD